jgi:3-hydroxyacyl-[acyl-carrier-protein] dehydratase
LSRLVSLVLTTIPRLFLASPVNTDEIKACIPHRDPFLWLDEVTEISETHIVARKVLKESLPVFQGHYPSFPVFPGVLQCEACFQAGAVLISKLVPTGSNEVPVVTRLNNVQFRKMIRPGETIELSVELTERVANAFYLKGKCSVDGKVTARLEFVCTAAAVEAS